MKYGFYVSNNASRLKLFLNDVSVDVDDIAFILGRVHYKNGVKSP